MEQCVKIIITAIGVVAWFGVMILQPNEFDTKTRSDACYILYHVCTVLVGVSICCSFLAAIGLF